MRQWVYEPTVVNGARVPVIISVAVEFKLTAPQPIRVGGEIKPPTQTKRVTPPYPPEAQAAGVQGIVIMEATIGADGKVTDVRVLRSIPLLDQAAMDAVRQFEYTPTVINGVAVPVEIEADSLAGSNCQRRDDAVAPCMKGMLKSLFARFLRGIAVF